MSKALCTHPIYAAESERSSADSCTNMHLSLSTGSIREQGPEFFLKEEIAEARRAVKQLDEAVTKATSFREKSSHLLEDANRALSRLEQVGMSLGLGRGCLEQVGLGLGVGCLEQVGLGLGVGCLEQVGLGLTLGGCCLEHIGTGFAMGSGCLQGTGCRVMTAGL